MMWISQQDRSSINALVLVLLLVAAAFFIAASGERPTAVEGAGTWKVPDGYSVRAYQYGPDLAVVFVIQPPDELDAERKLYAYWGVIHQAQARRLDATVLNCWAVGDLTIECDERPTTTFGSERGNHPAGIAIPRRY